MKTNEESAIELLLSLYNDVGLRELMRPDQIRRIEAFISKLDKQDKHD